MFKADVKNEVQWRAKLTGGRSKRQKDQYNQQDLASYPGGVGAIFVASGRHDQSEITTPGYLEFRNHPSVERAGKGGS
jgi:hypothetical protein